MYPQHSNTQIYHPHAFLQRGKTGHLPLHTHACIYIYIYGCGIDFSVPHVSEAGISIKHEKSGALLKASSFTLAKLLKFSVVHTKGRRSGCERM